MSLWVQFLVFMLSTGAIVASAQAPTEVRSEQTVSEPAATPYVLQQHEFATKLAAVREGSERRKILNERWEQIKLAVTHCNVVKDISFSNSVAHWKNGFLPTGRWAEKSQSDLDRPLKKKNASVWIQGDCRADVASRGGRNGRAMIHILGNLAATLTVEGHAEIVIGGNIEERGGIVSNGITRVFVGGEMKGFIRDGGSCMVWVHGDLSGKVETGVPIMDLQVMGDFNGEIKPMGEPALLTLQVGGFMANESIVKIANLGMTDFRASIGTSDIAPGLYPSKGMVSTARASVVTWVIHQQRKATP